MAKPVRVERDSLGTVAVPASAYYGAQTARALQNFPISGRRIHRRIVEAYCHIKRGAAIVNRDVGVLSAARSRAIVRAADEVLAGRLQDQFVVDVFQAGAGTSTNMNVNEVLCNRALELLGKKRGDYGALHPNDHVNLGQSTNDTYPTAMRLAVTVALDELDLELTALCRAFVVLGNKHAKVVKSGRTHLQDAVPTTLGLELGAYGRAVEDSGAALRAAGRGLLSLGIGGTAVGTGMNAHPAFGRLMVRELRKSTGGRWRQARDLVQAMQSQAAIGAVSAALQTCALEIGRIANDLRLLASGPTTGLAEIVLPEVQAGSSIMPGKVNPSILEMVNMVCFQVVGNHLTVSLAVGAGQLELNVMMPIMAEKVIESVELLAAACRQLRERAVVGIEADVLRCADYAHRSLGLATALAPAIGYAAAAKIAKQARAEGKTIPEVVRAQRVLPAAELARLLTAAQMTRPSKRR
ncbi:MAG: aspartate ammonia-lyase [Deltaproteobacteria bacterium]|nr:aspartate ammonia-lyase [Deltaproteobacteria bacterium]